MYGDPDFNVFKNYVLKNYDVKEEDIYKRVNDEYGYQLSITENRKTSKQKKRVLDVTLANCRLWLSLDRKDITVEDLVKFRPARLWFNSIKKRDQFSDIKKFPAMEETHCQGLITIENIPTDPLMNNDLGIQIAEDGRVWICIDGIAILRFKPKM